MNNTFIGFKQADGTFYPVLRDGIAESKQLDVTTVRDDQTTVKINLYKKNTDSLDEPEYVDTLLIENLIPHPKTEPTIHLNINLDEDNVLTAEISDPETGNKSDIRVSMVTLPEDQLDAEPDFTLSKTSDDIPLSADPLPDDFSIDTPEALSFDMPDLDIIPENTDKENTAEDETGLSEELSFDMPEDLNFDTAENSDFDMPDLDEPEPVPLQDTEENFDGKEAVDMNDNPENNFSAKMPFDMPDFGEQDAFASTDSEEFNLTDEAPIDNEEPLPHKDEDLGDFSLDTPEETSAPAMSFDMDDFDDFSSTAANGAAEDISPSFDMPEPDAAFSMPDTPPFDTEQNASLNMPPEEPDFEYGGETETKKKFSFGHKKYSSFEKENPPLYDRNLPDDIDETSNKRRCRIAVIICIICAILCILAVIGIFLLFPWKKSQTLKTENIVTVEPPSQMHMQPPPEEPAKPEENTIVAVEKETVEKREVIPEKVESVPDTQAQAVRHRLKWGDTLWDLSDTYYRNPWLYPVIARENKIKNPDLIIAGTDIIIPPR